MGCKCYYCNHDLEETGIGLDRIDNDKGYLENNVVPCCWICNKIKGVIFTTEEMKIVGKSIKQIKNTRPIKKQGR